LNDAQSQPRRLAVRPTGIGVESTSQVQFKLVTSNPDGYRQTRKFKLTKTNMKTFAWIVAAALAVGLLFAVSAAEKISRPKLLWHVVAFKFKATATPADIKKVETAFGELKTKIPTIVSLEWGTNVSPEKRDKGFTHCFLLSFKTDKDRDDYLVHPEHKAFGGIVGPLLDDVFVFDFWARD
jgi:hypothetical protein